MPLCGSYTIENLSQKRAYYGHGFRQTLLNRGPRSCHDLRKANSLEFLVTTSAVQWIPGYWNLLGLAVIIEWEDEIPVICCDCERSGVCANYRQEKQLASLLISKNRWRWYKCNYYKEVFHTATDFSFSLRASIFASTLGSTGAGTRETTAIAFSWAKVHNETTEESLGSYCNPMS